MTKPSEKRYLSFNDNLFKFITNYKKLKKIVSVTTSTDASESK